VATRKERTTVASPKTPEPPSLLPLRSALIVLIAMIVGFVVGGLTLLAEPSVPKALLAGIGAAAAALLPLDKVIGR
jgi:hypothetical protein